MQNVHMYYAIQIFSIITDLITNYVVVPNKHLPSKGDVGREERNRRVIRNQDLEEGHHHPGLTSL